MTSTTVATRRAFIGTGAGGVAALVLPPALALADAQVVQDEIRKLYGDKRLNEGRIKLDLPPIAENGLAVPLSFEVESPMAQADYVKAVHLFAEGNPSPLVASFMFTPLAPRAAASIRIRLAKTQSVVAVAEMSDGNLYTAARDVKVTIGGCGG